MLDHIMQNKQDHLFRDISASFFLIAGPCVIESEALLIDIAGCMDEITKSLGISYVFKASFDKANRTSLSSFRGIGIDKGLQALAQVKKTFQIPLLTDIHDVNHIDEVAQVVDILQIPAFLCRQTDLLVAAAKTGKLIQVKKGQFVSSGDMKYVAEKVVKSGNNKIILCERGTSFGYHDLVVDMRGLKIMRDLGYPVVFERDSLCSKSRRVRGYVRWPATYDSNTCAGSCSCESIRFIHGNSSRS